MKKFLIKAFWYAMAGLGFWSVLHAIRAMWGEHVADLIAGGIMVLAAGVALSDDEKKEEDQ